MFNIFKKICFFLINLIPNKTARHSLREKFNRYFGLEIVPMTAIGKKIAFSDNEYETCAIGSSHGESSFNPEYIEGSAFNFCISSSDGFMMYEIYRNFIKNSKTKNVVVFYDVFTRGSNNSKLKGFEYHFFPLKYILGINYQGENKHIKGICKRIMKKYNPDNNHSNGFAPYVSPVVSENEVESHYKSHLKIWNRNGENKWIVKIAKECGQDNKNFVLVLSPATKLYKNFMPDSETLFKDILEELNNLKDFSKFGKIYNFYDTDEFEDKVLWIDPDHFNSKGAEIFTKALNNKLEQDKIIKV